MNTDSLISFFDPPFDNESHVEHRLLPAMQVCFVGKLELISGVFSPARVPYNCPILDSYVPWRIYYGCKGCDATYTSRPASAA